MLYYPTCDILYEFAILYTIYIYYIPQKIYHVSNLNILNI